MRMVCPVMYRETSEAKNNTASAMSSGSELGNTEPSQELGLHPATINRIVKILSQKKFLQQNERSRKFKLGPAAFRLGRTVIQSLSGSLFNIAYSYIHALCERVGETLVLVVMSEKRSIVAMVGQGCRGMIIGLKVGDIVPNHAAARES